MLEAALDEEVSEAIDHERISLLDNGIDNLKFLFWSAHLELLLQEDGSLLIVVAHDLVHDVLPVTAHVAVKQTTVVEWFGGADVRWAVLHLRSWPLSLAWIRKV